MLPKMLQIINVLLGYNTDLVLCEVICDNCFLHPILLCYVETEFLLRKKKRSITRFILLKTNNSRLFLLILLEVVTSDIIYRLTHIYFVSV